VSLLCEVVFDNFLLKTFMMMMMIKYNGADTNTKTFISVQKHCETEI